MVTHGCAMPQVRQYGSADRYTSQADSASSILVTRSEIKHQVSGAFPASLGFSRPAIGTISHIPSRASRTEQRGDGVAGGFEMSASIPTQPKVVRLIQ
jgi:hypothetical protein